MEIYLVAINLLCWWLALEYLARNPLERLRNPWALYAAWAVAGLGGLAKSPLYSALWGVGFWIHLAITREWREFKNPHHWFAIVFGALLGATWFAAVYHLDGEAFVSQYFLRETLAKAGGNGGTIGELWQSLLVYCLPWAPLALLGLIRLIRGQGASREFTGFVVASTVPSALFFTLYPYRIGPYLYVLVPTAALLAAWVEAEHARGRVVRGIGWTRRLTAIALGLVSAYLAWVGIRAGIFTVTVNLAVCVLAGLWFWSAFRPRQWVVAALGVVFWYHLAAVSLGERDLRGLRDYAEKNPHRGLSMLDDERNIWHDVGLLSLALKKPIERLVDVDEVIDALEDGQAVVLSSEQSQKFGAEIRQVLAQEMDGRELEVVHWSRLSTRRQLPLGDLLRARRKLEFGRDFQILSLPPDMEREVPEGGV
jgi:4-amino-4-deoxy-L-arabinose transferase-like glycosyltransferase